MAYVKLVWVDNSTPDNAANMNHLENGLESAASVADQAFSLASSISTSQTVPEVDMAMLVAWSN